MRAGGLIIVDKPAGMTSHDVVDRVRRILRQRRVGHAGTLDPFATGVLPICFGASTRLTGYLADHPKRYLAGVRFGYATTTDDFTGEPLGAPAEVVSLDAGELARACGALEGEIEQVVPAYSAKRVGGRRLHERARAGETVQGPATRVRIDRIELVGIDGGQAVLDISCSAGTYVRALARDLGRLLGSGGHLRSLRRTEAAGFTLAEAVSLDELALRRETAMVPPERVLSHWPAVALTDAELEAVRHGRLLRREVPVGAARVRLLSRTGDLVALCDVVEASGSAVASLQPRVVLLGPP